MPTYVDPIPLPLLSPTSKVLKPVNGEWSYGTEVFLVPHEGLRVLTERTRQVLEFYNPEQYPWKAERVKRWFKEYYIPVVHEHHDNEEKIFFPFYKELGAKDFEKQGADHKTLIKNLDAVLSALDTNKGDEVREKFKIYVDHLLEHLEEEETYWPPVIEKFGEANSKKVVSLIVSEGQKHGGMASKMFLIDIVEAMGCNLHGNHPNNGWASKNVKDVFKRQFPGFARSLIIPGWERTRAYYHDLFMSITSDKETVVIKQPGGCQCVLM